MQDFQIPAMSDRLKGIFLFGSFTLPLLGILAELLIIVGIHMYASSVGVEVGLLDHYLSDTYGMDARNFYVSLGDMTYLTAFILYLGGMASGLIALAAGRGGGWFKLWLVLLFILTPLVYLVGCDFWGCHI